MVIRKISKEPMEAATGGALAMGVNREDDDGSGDSWNRSSQPGGEGDFHGPNYLGIGLIVIFVVLLGIAIRYT